MVDLLLDPRYVIHYTVKPSLPLYPWRMRMDVPPAILVALCFCWFTLNNWMFGLCMMPCASPWGKPLVPLDSDLSYHGHRPASPDDVPCSSNKISIWYGCILTNGYSLLSYFLGICGNHLLESLYFLQRKYGSKVQAVYCNVWHIQRVLYARRGHFLGNHVGIWGGAQTRIYMFEGQATKLTGWVQFYHTLVAVVCCCSPKSSK